MKNLELEIKILDINKNDFIKKLETLNATFKETNKQYLYTYDLPTIYGRYIDILTQINNPESSLKYETSLQKLKLLFFELDNLLTNDQISKLKEITSYESTTLLLNDKDLKTKLNDQKLIKFMKQFLNNQKKWIRVRKTNNITKITIKHILKPNETSLQQMLETELDVPSIEDANNLLEALGYSFKSYQEKERTTYILDNHDIEIDSWPGIPTYIEIEGTSELDLEKIVNKLGYNMTDCMSCTADDIYKKYGKSMFDKRELKFSDYEEGNN